jgi:iron complex outermembrane receptor protein
MTNRKRAFWATTALFSGLLLAGAASAQSTGTEASEATQVGEVVVTGARGARNIDGLAVAENIAKTRNTINQEFISTQTPGQTILQTLNLTPGLSFTNADPYGSSGGNIRLRGFDGARVSLTFDGIPLNDTGNYSAYTNQQLDSELIERASINTGTTDVDSPTASATGGTINYVTRRPASEFGGWGQASFGDFEYQRFMALIDTGEFGPWNTSAWFAVSRQTYDKFKGRGDLQKTQFNARIYQPIGDNGDFVSLAAHYNENRNYNYLGPNLQNGPTPAQPFDTDFVTTYTAPTFRNGVGDFDTNSTNFYGLRVNPSNTGNIRGSSRFTLAEGLVLTVDPSFQYTLANGGTQQAVLAESFAARASASDFSYLQLLGSLGTGGVDLNGDGDTLDRVRVMTPSNTNTHRYGLNTSLIWDLNDNHRLRAAYALDWGRHRQTGEYGFINFSNPVNPRFRDWFGGRNDEGNRVINRDGYNIQARDRLSYATLNQFSLEYRGQFLEDALTISLGVRAPFFKRELNQNCFSQNASSNVLCTTETPNAPLANGNVTFAGRGTTQYIAPYAREVKYDDILPNVGATFRFGEGQSVYASYAENLSAPRTDSLYTVARLADGSIGNPTVQPESTQTFDVGYRYTTSTLLGTIAAFSTSYDNRIVNTYDEDLGTFVDRNVGAVELRGVEASVGWSPIEQLSLYASASFLDSELQDDYVLTRGGAIAATKGKELVETPNEMFSARASYEFTPWLQAGVQAKYTGERWVTDVNDLKVDAYTVVDFDARIDFAPMGYEGTFLQLNLTNAFDEEYYGGLGTRTTITPTQPGYSATGAPFAQVGAPRTFVATLRVAF